MGNLKQEPVMKALVSLPSQNPQRFAQIDIEQEENVLCRTLQGLPDFIDTTRACTPPSQAKGKDARACEATASPGSTQQGFRQSTQSHLHSVVWLAPCIRVDVSVVTQGL